jgi:hypothetical protein
MLFNAEDIEVVDSSDHALGNFQMQVIAEGIWWLTP